MANRLEQKYSEQAVPALIKRFGFKNSMEVPRLTKITLNMGVGEGGRDMKVLEALRTNMAQIAAQQPVITRARKSISNFKLRQGMPIGCMVTLRRERMWAFFDRLISVAIPRIRDFRGLPSKSFDGRGNYSFGLTEQLVFPEIHYDSIPMLHGMDITIVTSARNDEEGRELLTQLGMPFRK
jgi:large subunit ribosomal protein L5